MKQIFTFLDERGLKDGRSANVLGRMDEEEFHGLLRDYVEFVRTLPRAKDPGDGIIVTYPDSWGGDHVDLSLVKQFCLYTDCHFVHDPLIQYLREMDQEMWFMPGYTSRDERFAHCREMFSRDLGHLLELRPLVDIDAVVIIPSHLTHEHSDPNALYDDDCYGPAEDADTARKNQALPLPKPIEDFLAANLKIWTPQDSIGQGTYPNHLMLSFDNESRKYGRKYCEIRIRPDSAETRIVDMVYNPSRTLSKDEFENWARGESRKLGLQRFRRLQWDLMMSWDMGATFVTPLRATRDLLGVTLIDGFRDTNRSSDLPSLLLPYFQNVTISDLAKARRDGESYHAFRRRLNQVLRELDQLPEGPGRTRRGHELVRDVMSEMISDMNRQTRRLKRSIFSAATQAFGTLGLGMTALDTFVNSPFAQAMLVLYGAYAVGSVLTKYRNEQDTLRALPGHFYWSVTGGSSN